MDAVLLPPALVSGTYVYHAPWGDAVLVSARHWGDAAATIYYDGRPSQWQVADFRHCPGCAAAWFFADGDNDDVDVEEVDISFADGGLTLAAWQAAETIRAAAEDIVLDADDPPEHVTALYEAADMFGLEFPSVVMGGENVEDAMRTVIDAVRSGVDPSDPDRAAEIIEALETFRAAKEAAEEALGGMAVHIAQ